jgi:hypothetical protein
MAEPGVGYGKHLGVFLFLRLESGILFVRCKPSLSAASYVRLGHATSIVTRANPSKEDYTGSWLRFGASPYQRCRGQGRRRVRERWTATSIAPNNAKT